MSTWSQSTPTITATVKKFQFASNVLACSIEVDAVTVSGVDAIEVELSVEFEQLTNAFPAGNGGLGLLMPDNLIGRAVVPLVPPL